MPSIYQLKKSFQNLLRPLVGFLAARGVTANQVTVFACLLSFAGGAAVYWLHGSWGLFAVPAILFVRMALNAIDGMLAREHDQKTPLGAILNELGDVASDAALYLPFAAVPGFSGWLVAVAVVLAIFTEMAGVLSQTIGGSRRYDGPMGKSDRAFAFGLAALLIGFDVFPLAWRDPAMGVAAALTAFTVWNRVRGALKEIAKETAE